MNFQSDSRGFHRFPSCQSGKSMLRLDMSRPMDLSVAKLLALTLQVSRVHQYRCTNRPMANGYAMVIYKVVHLTHAQKNMLTIVFNKVRSYHRFARIKCWKSFPITKATWNPSWGCQMPNDHMIVLDCTRTRGVRSRNGDVVWCGMLDSYMWILVLVWYLNLDILNGHSLVWALFFRRSPENYPRSHSEHAPNPVFSDAR